MSAIKNTKSHRMKSPKSAKKNLNLISQVKSKTFMPVRSKKDSRGSLIVKRSEGSEILQSNQYKSLALRSMFWRPDYLQGSSAWVEHLPFAFWIVEALQPSLFVELGTHYGHSYFSFCQAIKRLGLNTPSYAVDTWKGDDQAGHYDESVYQRVESYNQTHYPEFSSLLRCSFDEAVNRFNDGSIDLLHIDGFHTYEAVRHDFELWLPKLSARAVVLFHDTNVRRDLFGIHKYFAELAGKYPHFEFIHGHGLGVLGVGRDQGELLQSLYNCYAHQASRNIVYELFSRLGRSCHDLMDLNQAKDNSRVQENRASSFEKIANDRATEIEHLTGELRGVSDEIQARSAHINHLEVVTGERGFEIERLSAEIARITQESKALGEHVVHLEQVAGERGAAIERLNAELAQLTEQTGTVSENQAQAEQIIAEKAAEVERLAAEIAHITEESNARHEHIVNFQQMVAERGAEIERLNGEVARLTEEAGTTGLNRAQLEQTVAEKAAEVERLSGDLEASLQSITEMRWYVGERDAWVSELKKDNDEMTLALRESGAEIERLNGELVRLNQVSAAKSSQVVHLEQVSDERETEIKRLKVESDQLNEEILNLEKVSVDQSAELDLLQTELSEKTASLERYIQESVQMARMIIEAQDERDAKQVESDRLQSELSRVTEESNARANHIVHLEQVAGEQGIEVDRLGNELREKSESLDRYVHESAQMARMIIEAQDERDAWRRMSVNAEIEEVIPGSRHEVGEHQHINYTLKGITHLGRKFSKLDVRIVEHRGNPGVVIMEPIAEERPFYAWERNGDENGMGFMLIIPTEKKGKDWLVRTTTNDLLLTKDIINYIMRDILKEGSDKKWSEICTEVQLGIDNIPLRLHYDDVKKMSEKNGIIEAEIVNPSVMGKVIQTSIIKIKDNKIQSARNKKSDMNISFKRIEQRIIKSKIYIECRNINYHLNKSPQSNAKNLLTKILKVHHLYI